MGPMAWPTGGAYAYIHPLGLYIRSLGLVSWPAGCAYAPIGGAYPSTGGVYPIIGSGFVACWVCMGVRIHPLGVYIHSLVLVSWSVAGVFLRLVGCFMAVESLSGSWSAQVPERPAAVGSRLEYPRGCRGVDPCWPSRRIPVCRRFGRIDAPLRPFAWFYFGGGLAAGRSTVETSLTLRPFACSVAHLCVCACFRDHPQNLAFRCGRP